MYLKIILLATLVLFNYTNGAKILCVFNIPSYSHYILGHRLVEELALKGHEVTMVSSYKSENANFTQVYLEGLTEQFEGMLKSDSTSFLTMRSITAPKMLIMFNEMMLKYTKLTLNHPNFKKLLKEDYKYDVIILEQFLNEALKGLCHHYQAPCIAFSTVGSNQFNNHLVANPTFPSFIPDSHFSYSRKMSIMQRLTNSLFYVFQYVMYNFKFFPKQNALMHRHFPNAPHLQDLMSNTSLVLLNSHPSINQAVPHTPNMIEIGGFHVKPAKKLPDDLQKFLDNSPNGVVFFSLGSNVKSKDLPADKMNSILTAFSKLKQKVLWKFEEKNVANLPKNVMIAKWLPQQSILAHPNVKLFVTHGGLLSVIESINYGVPMVGIPIFADQAYNMQENALNGIAVKLDYDDLNEKTLFEAMDTVLYDKSYSENAKTRSQLLHDQPLKPLDAAVYWTEYVIKHNGAKHMRSAAFDLAWYQYLLLDVTIVVTLVVLALIAIYIKCFMIAINFFCSKQDKKPKLKKIIKKKKQ